MEQKILAPKVKKNCDNLVETKVIEFLTQRIVVIRRSNKTLIFTEHNMFHVLCLGGR